MADYKSSTLLNSIRTSASSDYQNRVPTATQNNLAQVGSAILNYAPARNEMVNMLFNKIALSLLKSAMFENPLKEFKKNSLTFGGDIEEVYVDLMTAQTYDVSKAESELFKRVLPDIKAVFHRVNRQDFYKTSISLDQLQLAFQSEAGFQSLIDKIINTLYVSDNYDEFLIMKHLIEQNAIEGKFNVQTISAITDNASAKAGMEAIKKISNQMTFISSQFNHAGVKTSTPKADQIILLDTNADAVIDVELLASAFNMSKADFESRRVLLDDFGGISNVICAIVDKDWFMCFDKDVRSEEIYNPQGLYYNYFLHHWAVMSTSPFANAVLFTSVTPTLTALTLTPATATVLKGDSLQFAVETTGTGNPSSKCTWGVDGNSGNTYVTSTGLLVVGKDETKTTLTVTATSVFNNTESATATITVS